MQQGLEVGAEHEEGIASLTQRLQQVSYGYHQPMLRSSTDPHASSGDLRPGRAQLEAPLQHANTWALLPVRKPLLTKRSRRCRLTRNVGSIEEGEPPSEQCPGKACKGIVVKPQINPCSNPPFQKNNVAVSFVPRCIPWAWRPEGAAEPSVAVSSSPKGVSNGATAAPKGLHAGETAHLLFSMANPLDTDIELNFDPSAFNPNMATSAQMTDTELMGNVREVGEQNVEVLTKPFQTVIARFNDLADVHEAWTEDSDKMKNLKERDDLDIIPERKLHKIMVRFRFRSISTTASATEDCQPWVFFSRLDLTFTDASSVKHRVKLILRFSLDAL